MKKWLIPILIISLLLSGCGPSLNQLRGEEAYYAARVAMTKQAASTVLFEMTASDTTKPIVFQNVASFKVFAPPVNSNENLAQYTHRDTATPWIQAFLQSLGILAPWAGAAVIVGQIAGGVSGPVTNTNVNASGSSQAMTGGTMSNATSVPTVVNPVIVQPVPVIVQPSYPPTP